MAAVNKRCLLLFLLLHQRRKRRKQYKWIWVRVIFHARSSRGEYHSLTSEMCVADRGSFYKYFHMTPDMFSHLLNLVGPSITRKTTNFRAPISAAKRLAITLRYLVTGNSMQTDSMQTISSSYRVGHSTVWRHK